MGKNKHKHRQNAPPIAQVPSTQQPAPGAPAANAALPSTPGEAAAQITIIAGQANKLVTGDDLANLTVPLPPPLASEINLQSLWQKVHEAKELFEHAQTRAQAAELEASKREEEAREVGAQVHKREEALGQQKVEQRKSQRDLDERKTSLDRRAGLIQEKQRPPGQTGRSADFQSAWVRDRRIVEPRPDESRRSVFLNQP